MFCLCLAGCGYTLVGQGSLPKHIETIAIPIFGNPTIERGIEDIITDAFIEKFVQGGKLKLVSGQAADAVLIGAIRSYQADEAEIVKDGSVTSYKLVVTIDVELRDRKNDIVLWAQENIKQEENFPGGPDVNPIDEQEYEEEALKRLAEELAERVFTLSTEQF